MSILTNKVAIVTGCGSGIGAATVQRLRDEGAMVLGTDVKSETGRRVAEAAGAAFAYQDVADRAGWPVIVAHAFEEFGRLDILVNNAAVLGGGSIAEVSDAQWDRVLAVNLTGTMAGCRASIPAMVRNPGGPKGSIINIASTTAMTPVPSDVGYSASKGAVRVLSKAVATWCAQQGYEIRCNSVIPGATLTSTLEAEEIARPGLKAAVAAASPMNRLGRPAEIAAAILFLASHECPFMTGAELLADGGALSIHPGF